MVARETGIQDKRVSEEEGNGIGLGVVQAREDKLFVSWLLLFCVLCGVR